MVASLRIRIPEGGRSGLIRLAELSPEQFIELSNIYGDVQAKLPWGKFLSSVATKVTFDSGNARAITDAVLNLCYSRASYGLSNQQVIDDVMRVLSRPDTTPRSLADAERDTLIERLGILLAKDDSLGVVAKGTQLGAQNERIFNSVQVISDVRPIFSADSEVTLLASLVQHTVRVSYVEDGMVRDFYVSLTTEDLAECVTAFERAGTKAKRVERLMANTDAPIVEREP